MGDVTHIYSTDGALQATYLYDAWGNCKILDADGSEVTDTPQHLGYRNPIRYRGYYYDTETDLYYLMARYYDPETGRFLSQDDMSFLAPEHLTGLNLFAYCNNNPVMCVDPGGHLAITSAIVVGLITGAIVGAGIGFGTTAYSDYKDDGQIFNGSVSLKSYIQSTLTSSVLGAGVGGIIGAGGPVLVGAISSTANKFIADLFAYTLTGTSLGTWEDYAIAFISGGMIKGFNMNKVTKTVYDVLGRPLVTQVAKIGTNRQDTFNKDKYAYDVITRGLTTFVSSPWKAFYRGGAKSFWDLNKRGYFS